MFLALRKMTQVALLSAEPLLKLHLLQEPRLKEGSEAGQLSGVKTRACPGSRGLGGGGAEGGREAGPGRWSGVAGG